MNGTVLPSSSNAITAATEFGARPNAADSGGTGSKFGTGAAVSSVMGAGDRTDVGGARQGSRSWYPGPMDRLIRLLPKVELHLHIEGTLEPEMMFSLAAKHGVSLPYASVDAVRAAYNFHDLQSFLDLYYAGCAVLRDRSDFYALAMAYFARAHADRVVHAELFFDPQTHTA